jgi:hypothetical protein
LPAAAFAHPLPCAIFPLKSLSTSSSLTRFVHCEGIHDRLRASPHWIWLFGGMDLAFPMLSWSVTVADGLCGVIVGSLPWRAFPFLVCWGENLV